MKKKENSEKEVTEAVKAIVDQCSKIKTMISSGKIDGLPKEFLSSHDADMIRNLFSAYPKDYRFTKDSIYYDCKANTLKHLKAYYKLSSMCEILQGKSFNCFPLRRTFIPSYMTIDTLILNTQILKNPVTSHLDKEVVWGAVLDFTKKSDEATRGKKSNEV
jgi:hypothetical protein